MWAPYEDMSPEIEAALLGLARAADVPSVDSLIVHVAGGEVMSASLFDDGGVQHFLNRAGGVWLELADG